MKDYSRIDPKTYDCKFVYVVTDASRDEEANLTDRFESVLSFLSEETVNSSKFNSFLHFLIEEKSLFVLSSYYTEIDWDLIREYARIDDLGGIMSGMRHDVEKLYEYLKIHRMQFLKDF